MITRIGAAIALALALGGCVDAVPTQGDAPSLTFAVKPTTAFTIAAAAYEPGALAQMKGFPMRVTVALPSGGYVRAYGMRSVYEEVVSPVKGVVPLPGRSQSFDVRCEPLSLFDAGGARAMKDVGFWLVNDRGEESNHIIARMASL